MNIKITNDSNLIDKAEILIKGDWTTSFSKSGDEYFVVPSGRREELIVGMGGDRDEDSVEHIAASINKALEYAVKKGYSYICFDVSSFICGDMSVSYIANSIIDLISEYLHSENDAGNLEVLILLPNKICKIRYLDSVDKIYNEGVSPSDKGDFEIDLLDKFDSFSKKLPREKPIREYILELIDTKQIKKFSTVYKLSGISKYTFSNLISFKGEPHKPSKETVAALTIGLRLSMEEAEKLYNSAGFHLGKNEFLDRVIRFFITEKIYDIDYVNECLYYYGYPPLGERPRTSKIDVEMKF